MLLDRMWNMMEERFVPGFLKGIEVQFGDIIVGAEDEMKGPESELEAEGLAEARLEPRQEWPVVRCLNHC